jgi:hypothetical protein
MSVLTSDARPLAPHAVSGSKAWAAIKPHALPFLFCAALWAACHPYPGIVGDSRIYIGRILADLDPAGVGRDMIFVNDGQFRFSLFPLLARDLVSHLGPALAAQIIATVGCLCWFAAATALARQLATGRALWLVLALVCVLPHGYGNHMFVPAETVAVPRPFAEAAVLASFAALVAGRRLLAIAFVLVALLIHPIMGLPGAAVIAAMHLRDWRVVAASAVLVLLGIIAGLAGLPLFDRLFIRIDAEWLDLLHRLDPYLFPTHWYLNDFSPLVAQAATIAIAADLLLGTARRTLVASLLVGLGGLLVAIVLGDLLHNLLAIQVQPWRSAWIIAVIAQYAYAICAMRLSTGEMRAGQRRVTLALLTLGWFANPSLILALPVAAMALAVHFGRFAKPIAARYVIAIWIIAVALILSSYASVLANFLQFLARMPPGAALAVLYGLRVDIVALPICVIAFAWWAARPHLLSSPMPGSAAVLGCSLMAAATWSWRSEAARDFETLRNPREFAAILDNRPGEVLWVDAKSEGWQVLGRPQWGSAQQSASVVFSRPLAMLWRERAQELLDNRLIQANVFAPWQSTDASAIPNVTREALQRICARKDGPVAIIFPLEKGKPLPAEISAAIWTLPHPRFVPDVNEKNIWHEVDRYAAVACADKPDSQAERLELDEPALRGGLL